MRKPILKFLFFVIALSGLLAGCNQMHLSNGRPIKHVTNEDGLTTYPGRWNLPQYLYPAPNDVTLSHYFNKWLNDTSGFDRYRVQPTGNATPFKKVLGPSTLLEKEIQEKSLLSYLYFDNGIIKYDALAPASRFDFTLDETTEFRTNSVGKSFVSYLVGHAICEGHIGSINAPLSDWPVLQDTLYESQTLLDLLNMRARDQHVVTEDEGFIKTGRWFNSVSVMGATWELKGTQPNTHTVYNYQGFATNIALSYMIFKVGDDWQKFLNSVFQDKIRISHKISFMKTPGATEEEGRGRYTAFATRYDYLRIARAMLKDWQQDTCVGRYLKDIYKSRKPKNHGYTDRNRMTDVAKSYGGQFHLDFEGMQDRVLFGLNGYGGQNILIDMNNSRIVVTNTAHTNFNWRELVYNVIRDGELDE